MPLGFVSQGKGFGPHSECHRNENGKIGTNIGKIMASGKQRNYMI